MKKSIRRIISVVLCMIMAVTSVGVTVSGADTLTLKEDSLFIDGYPDKTFMPDKTMTRAEAIKVTSVVAGYSARFNPGSVSTAFTDMVDSEWYVPNVKYLEKYGLLDFFGTTLDASKGITRGEFVKLISSFIPTKAGSKSFPDVPKTHPYYNEIIKAAKAGIVEGNPDGTFNPDGTLTRAQIVTIIDRLLGRNIVDSNTRKIAKFTDIAGHWAQEEIIAASCPATYEGKILWYNGSKYSANSPVDKTKLEFPTTNAILSGVDASDGAAVQKSIDAYAEKRIAEIRATTSDLKAEEGKTTYYVSADGNDENDGKSPEKAWKTLDKVSEMATSLQRGDAVLFRRGDEFRGKLKVKNYVTYSAYGEGAKPIINGSLKNYAGSDYWQPTNVKNVYVLKETFAEDVGNITFNGGEDYGIKKAAGINGTSLIRDLEFYHNPTTGELKLYSRSDPNTRFESIEIGTLTPVVKTWATATSAGYYVTIDNLCIKYGGGYGISFGSGSSGITVTNCEVGWCGGALQEGREHDPVRLGNGVEIHGAAMNFTVDNCYIYQMYDTGVSHQYFNNPTNPVINMKNIKYTNNVITHCTYALEYINSQEVAVMSDVEICGNLFLKTGSGFGNQRPERLGSLTAGIKGWGGPNNAKDFLIYDNVIEATHRDAALIHMYVDDAVDMPEVTGNLFVSKEGNKFGLYGIGEYERDKDMITYNKNITNTTVGLDDNTFVFVK